MESVHLIEHLIQEGNWMVKLDLKDAYFVIPIHQEHQKWLRFHWQHQPYQFQGLPFGLSSAPRVFTKATCPIVAWLRQLGMKIVSYIDDFLLITTTQEEARLQAKLMVEIFQLLGFQVNHSKSLLSPQQKLEFLGVLVSSSPPAFSLPPHKLKGLKAKATQLPKKSSSQAPISAREITQFIGTANAVTVAILPAPLFYRSLNTIFKKWRGD